MDKLLSVQDLSIRFGGIVAVDGVGFDVKKGSVTAIIGPNGAGKTTLFNMITGIYPPSAGRILLDGKDVTSIPLHRLAGMGMSRTFQNLRIFDQMSAIENVLVGFHLTRKCSLISELLGLPGMHRERAGQIEKAKRLLERVQLGDKADVMAGNLSYGQMKRLEIARSLATNPRILLLDEPAAGCNAVETTEIKNLIRDLKADGLTMVIVEHDMEMVMSVSDYVYVLDRGSKIAEGTPAVVTKDAKVIEAYLGVGAHEPETESACNA